MNPMSYKCKVILIQTRLRYFEENSQTLLALPSPQPLRDSDALLEYSQLHYNYLLSIRDRVAHRFWLTLLEWLSYLLLRWKYGLRSIFHPRYSDKSSQGLLPKRHTRYQQSLNFQKILPTVSLAGPHCLSIHYSTLCLPFSNQKLLQTPFCEQTAHYLRTG